MSFEAFHSGPCRLRPVGRAGFTLVEGLLVISLIVLLISMLQPALNKSRETARSMICLSNQSQLTDAWAAYANDYMGKVLESWQGNGGFQTGVGKHWYVALKPYYGHDKRVLLCASADRKLTPVGPGGNRGTALDGWKVYTDPPSHAGVEPDDYGGFGMNNWLEDPKVVGTGIGGSRPSGDFITRIEAKVPTSLVPVFGDCVWPDAGWPRAEDAMPSDTIDPEATGAPGWMKRFCLSRHGQAANISFMDHSARTIPFPDLWKLRWHRSFQAW
ncbi:MAG: hypothetical protein WD768_04815 [Phycisphaeraceae bacterium]